MDKEKEIEELKKVIRKGFETANCRNEYTKEPYPYFDSQILSIANCLSVAGYRKADEVRKETAKEILQDLYDEAAKYDDETMSLNTYEIKQLAIKYGIEVDE